MEPDEIKKIWQEMDLLKEKQQVSDNRIKEMLKNDEESTLAAMMKNAKSLMVTTPIVGCIIFCLASYKFFAAGGYYLICPLIFILICIFFVAPFQRNQYRLLKGIDLSNMSATEIMERILKYHNNVQKLKLYSIIFFFVYMGIWNFLNYILQYGSKIIWWLIVGDIIIYLALGLFLPPFLFKKTYYNNINRIKSSLEELKEFEKL